MTAGERPVKSVILVVAAVVLGLSAGAGGWLAWQATRPDIRPDFTLPDLEGQPLSISDWDGQVIALNFWASWCPPCVKEIPIFNALQADFGDDGLQFVGVALDRLDDAREFANEVELAYPTMQGVQDAMAVGEAYGNADGLLPFTVIIDRDGRIVERFFGEVSRDDIEPVIRDHL